MGADGLVASQLSWPSLLMRRRASLALLTCLPLRTISTTDGSGAVMRRRSFATIIVGPSPLLREGLARVLGAAAFRIAASAPSLDDLMLDATLLQQSILLIMDATDCPGAAVEQIV